VSAFGPNIDFSGARGSNTGDQFHELWALQQVLELLDPETELKAVGVEGVRSETPSQNAGAPTWDGVDCALYYGGTTLETADKIEFAQLKYSAANPDSAWSVSRLVKKTTKRANNSVIRKMADDFRGAQERLKQGAGLKIRLISNQPLSQELKKTLDARWSEPLENAGIEKEIVATLKRLSTAAGFEISDFQDFLETLDFSECGSGSRFAVREKVLETVVALLGDDVLSDVRNLQAEIRKLMLPERAAEIVTAKEILLWFGLSGYQGLFPCPADIRTPEKIVERTAADEIQILLTRGERLVCVHGVGGCGKTTLMRQIADRLPEGSATVFFDCYGGGRYLHSDDKRHLPENAFLHLANELAVALQLPLFLPRSGRYPATIKSFMGKLRLAGDTLKKVTPNGILLVLVDAADNSVVAAAAANPPEHPFVFDLFDANLSALPENVRIVTSCRTARRAELRLPLHTPEVVCPPFTLPKTQQHLGVYFPTINDNLAEQFHNLSNANPRVQAYAIAAAGGDQTRLLEALLPGGKSLEDVLEAYFKNALNKLGQRRIFEKLVGVLAFLPAPIATSSLSRITSCTEDTIRDFAMDLAPGLRLHGDSITISDEDFEAFIKQESLANRVTIIADIAADFLRTFKADPYSSIHVADLLIEAGRARDLLSVIEEDPQPAAISDPIIRRQVQLRRLKLSLAACREAGSRTDALKTVLISAEAERDDSTLRGVLEKELDLSVEFAGSSLRRSILLDRDRVKKHGPFLAQDAARAVRIGDHLTAREQLYFCNAWLKRRREEAEDEREQWSLTIGDIAARAETILELFGAKAFFYDLTRWTPRSTPIEVALILVPQMIASGRGHLIKALMKEPHRSGPWELILWVPLAMAGEPVSGLAIQRSLRRIRRCFVPDAGDFRIRENDWRKELLDVFIMACELAFKLGLDSHIILGSINRILGALEGKQKRRLYGSDACRLDGLLRCWLLREAISGKQGTDEYFIAYVKPLNPEPKPEKRPGGGREKQRPGTPHSDNQETERLNKKIRALFPVYSERLQILSCARKNQQVTEEQLDKLVNVASLSYDFDYDHDSMYLREMAAKSVTGLLIVENIEASALVKRASTLALGRFTDPFANRRQKLWTRMAFRTSESEELVLLVAKAAEDIKGQRAASSEKLKGIISLSRLVLPVSRSDSESLFNDALGIAKEIDEEAFAQIDFLSALAERSRIPNPDQRRTVAADIFTFVSGAAERLSDSDGFPWRSAVDALTCVEHITGLAAISRWADDGTVALSSTLEPFLLTALQRGIISLEVSTSLAVLIGGSAEDLRKDLISRTAADPQKYTMIIEELAKEILLLSPQNERLTPGQEIVDQISENDCQEGKWLAHLRKTVEFLRNAVANKPEERETIRPGEKLKLADGDDLPKEFEFDPQGRSFTTVESIAKVLEAAKTSGLFYRERDLFQRMRAASSSLRERVQFLNALAEAPQESIWRTDQAEMICDTVALWKGTPAVDRWCRESLPSVLVTHFYAATRWLKEGHSVLNKLLDYTGSDADGRLQIILAGIAHAGGEMSSRTLFAIAEEIARTLDPDQAATHLIWYAKRLKNRLPVEDQSLYSLTDIPDDKTEAVARFLFALMSDIDTRLRWKAAHALRLMARLGCYDIVKATILQAPRVKDDAFRNPACPFYFLAGKLWLAISLYRISEEAPKALGSCKSRIYDLATSSKLPHVVIREYAKRTLLQLASAGEISLSPAEGDEIHQVNTAVEGRGEAAGNTHRSFQDAKEEMRRFKFDHMDTIRYWYQNVMDIFPTVSQELFLDIAERWILNEWGADPEANRWDEEPRKHRFGERDFALWSHDHGSFPIIERYGTHLEWNAMHCVVGELLITHPISNGEDYFNNFHYWLGRFLPTDPPAWISDNRGPTPLEDKMWKEDPRTDGGWLHNVRLEEFLAEIGASGSIREGWIVVEGYYSVRFNNREANININSALVSPETASALVRALQTANDPRDFRIPEEDDHLQIVRPPYSLVGWIARVEDDMRFDERDPFRYEVQQVSAKPGRKLIETLGLVLRTGSHCAWICNETGEDALVHETWCDEPPPERDYYPRRIRSNGWRLWARADMVRSFLTASGWDLICEVQVNRRIQKEYGWSYETNAKRKTHEKILLLRSDGSIADFRGRIGSWTGISRGTRA
jgi:hypothetical protein